MKLLITDLGDTSVGLRPFTWTIDCPFDDADTETREYFRQKIEEMYLEYSEGRLISHYQDETFDFDIE